MSKSGFKAGVFSFKALFHITFLIGSILVYTPTFAASPCKGVIQELKAMKQAQNHIIISLAENHDVFATQLSDLSFELALYKKEVPPKALSAMDKSAEAYRLRSQRAYDTAQKLEASTEDLIRRVQSCLKR